FQNIPLFMEQQANTTVFQTLFDITDPVNDIVPGTNPTIRSEEHTSELQSQSNLVCRLLLEKKKMQRMTTSSALHLLDRGGREAWRVGRGCCCVGFPSSSASRGTAGPVSSTT